MNSEAVILFLGAVPLLQRLPSLSVKKIAQFVVLKHFDPGDMVIRNGEAEQGVYFICKGEVSGSVHKEKFIHRNLELKYYGYFGNGTGVSAQQDVIALTKLTCLLLPHEHCHLMQPKSIWSADITHEKFSFMEHILQLEPLEVNAFKGITLSEAPKSAKVFGGQFMGQALAAASKTVHFLKTVHSLHAHFILAGNIDIPIIYQVHRLHDGNSFSTRRVDALQQENVVFSLIASFRASNTSTLSIYVASFYDVLQEEEQGFDHQDPTMPYLPGPEVLVSMEELLRRHQRNDLKEVTNLKFQWPVEIRLCEPNKSTFDSQGPPSLRYWFRAKGELSVEQALHRCVGAYASDLLFLIVTLSPHRRKGLELTCTSLDHSMWFHRPFRADEWLLYVIDSPSTNYARGFVSGQIFNGKGELVASVKQVGVIWKLRTTPAYLVEAKL